jgi:hypothetical protein
MIQKAAPRRTKIFAISYVDLFSFNRTISNIDRVHQIMQVASDTVKAGAKLANIGLIEDVKSTFVGHEMYSADPYGYGLTGPNAAHPNLKGYHKIGEIVAYYFSEV